MALWSRKNIMILNSNRSGALPNTVETSAQFTGKSYTGKSASQHAAIQRPRKRAFKMLVYIILPLFLSTSKRISFYLGTNAQFFCKKDEWFLKIVEKYAQFRDQR